MLTGYISFVIFLIVLLIIIGKGNFFHIENQSRKLIYLSFFVKFFAAVGLWLVYTKFYTIRADADIFKYFDDAAYLFNATTEDVLSRWKIISGLQNDQAIKGLLSGTLHWDKESVFFFNDNRTLIRIHLFLLHFSRGFYFFHLLFFSTLSFLGSFFLFKFFTKFSNQTKLLLFIISFFLPSVLFWCSAPLKETLLFFGLGFFLYSLVSFCHKKTIGSAVVLCSAGLILASVKIYFLCCLIPPLAFLLLTYIRGFSKPLFLFLVVHAVFFLLLIPINNWLLTIISGKQDAFLLLLKNTDANSSIAPLNYSSFTELLFNIPTALFNVIVMPAWPPTLNLFGLFSSVESFIYLLILLLPLVRYRKVRRKEFVLFLFCGSFIFITSSLIGLTTPILGAIVRYKAPLLPFYLMMIFTFVRFPRTLARTK